MEYGVMLLLLSQSDGLIEETSFKHGKYFPKQDLSGFGRLHQTDEKITSQALRSQRRETVDFDKVWCRLTVSALVSRVVATLQRE